MSLERSIRDWHTLRSLRNKLRNIDKGDSAFRRTDKFKKLTAKEKAEYEDEYWQLEAGDIYAEIGELESNIFLRKVSKYIPPPSRHDEKTQDEYWKSNFHGEYRELSQNGYHELNKLVREEKKARREARLWWVSLIGPLTGLIGCLIALLSFLLNPIFREGLRYIISGGSK